MTENTNSCSYREIFCSFFRDSSHKPVSLSLRSSSCLLFSCIASRFLDFLRNVNQNEAIPYMFGSRNVKLTYAFFLDNAHVFHFRGMSQVRFTFLDIFLQLGYTFPARFLFFFEVHKFVRDCRTVLTLHLCNQLAGDFATVQGKLNIPVFR